MKCISLHQPHAIWVSVGWKTIETRKHGRYHNLIGQRIAIHAAKKLDKNALSYGPFLERMESGVITSNFAIWMARCMGCIVCTALVSDGKWMPAGTHDARAMCQMGGKYCLYLTGIKPLSTPVRWKGQQGIFNVPDELLAQ